MPERTLLHDMLFATQLPVTNGKPRRRNHELPSSNKPFGANKNNPPKHLYGEYDFKDSREIKRLGFDDWFQHYADFIEAHQRRSGGTETKDESKG